MIFKFNIVRDKSSNNLQIKVLIKDFNLFVSEDSPGIGQYVKVSTKEKSSDKYLFQICEIDNVKKALEGSDMDAIKDKTKALNDKAMVLATKVYEEAAKTAQANQNNNNAESTEAEEAEFVNKD